MIWSLNHRLGSDRYLYSIPSRTSLEVRRFVEPVRRQRPQLAQEIARSDDGIQLESLHCRIKKRLSSMGRRLPVGLGSSPRAAIPDLLPSFSEDLHFQLFELGVESVSGVRRVDYRVALANDVACVQRLIDVVKRRTLGLPIDNGPCRGMPSPVVGEVGGMKVEHATARGIQDGTPEHIRKVHTNDVVEFEALKEFHRCSAGQLPSADDGW